MNIVTIASSYLISIYIALVYILSTNGIFIDILGFGFNPSKLFLLITLPFVFLFSSKIRLELLDVLFLLFIVFGVLRFFVYNEFGIISDLTNFILPFLFYKVVGTHIDKINLNIVLRIILFFVFFHAIFGLIQFYTGDRGLLIVSEIQEYKIKYAREYSFNPFQELLLLPHGLYAYSSVLGISLIFPLFLVFAKNRNLISVILFGLMSITTFLTFSRFEIITIFLLIIFSIFVIKNNKIKYLRFFSIYFLGIGLIVIYMQFTSDAIGSVSARLIDFETLKGIFDIKSFFFGIDSLDNFLLIYKMHIPHNMYVFSVISYGIFCALFLLFYLLIKIYLYVIECKLLNHQRFYNYILLFLLFIIFYRAFDYYVIDGYENILLFFICFLFLDTLKFQSK